MRSQRRLDCAGRSLLLVALTLTPFAGAVAQSPSSSWDRDQSRNNVVFDSEEGLLRQDFLRYRAAHELESEEGQADLLGDNETAVVVNPADPSNVAYASLWELRVSIDGGQTFQPPVASSIPPTHYAVGDPSLAFDADGRLYWTYLASLVDDTHTDIFLAQCDPATGEVLPGYPVNISAQTGFESCTDKEWLAVDSWPGSPFANRLYVTWTDMGSGCSFANDNQRFTYSTDHGLTWATKQTLATGSSWPVSMAVASNGDVYVAYHGWTQIATEPGTGFVKMVRSTNGGASFAPATDPFPPGSASITTNIDRDLPHVRFWLQGSLQAWILPDPHAPSHLAVIACDDPENDFSSGDPSDVMIARSTNSGQTWTVPQRVESSASGLLQVMPSAAVDRTTGNIAVTWYDNREGGVNADGNYLLDTYAAVSTDGGASFLDAFRISDVPFDPDLRAPCRFNCPPRIFTSWDGGANCAYICGNAVYKWNGTSWAPVNPGGTAQKNGVWGASPSAVWIVGNSGEIRFWNGTQWSGQTSPTSLSLYKVHGQSATNVTAVGNGGAIVHWNGTNWSLQPSGFNGSLRGIWTLPGGTAWAAGRAGTVLHFDGVSWSPATPIPTDQHLQDVWATSDANVWTVGLNGGIYHWNGSSWTTIESNLSSLTAVWGSGPDDIYFAGWGNDVLHWNGQEMERQAIGGDVFDINGAGPDDILMSRNPGRATRFDGNSWVEQPVPVLPATAVLRIGEYTGTAVAGVRGLATWTGNSTRGDSDPPAQAAFFDVFPAGGPASAGEIAAGPSLLLLEGGHPNPFRWVTEIGYSLPEPKHVSVRVFDVSGRLVDLLDSGMRDAGPHDVTWDGRDASGRAAPAGTYFVRLEAEGKASTATIVLSR
ncbi:MAG: FlgD immunoglobulin-like domain containing protein [Candidatus Eisenbacteria bacterium]|nr:FlgD immunoglobulin-like domain containing protein [Candidatus Eisenbacteria bacterium]